MRNWYRYMNWKCFDLCQMGCSWFDVKTVVTQVRCVLILELYEIIGFSLRCKCRETNISASYYYVYGPSLKYIGYTPRCGKFVEVPLLNERIEAFGRMAWSFMHGYLPLGSACSTRRLFLVGKEVGAWSWPLFPSGAEFKNEWSYTSFPVCRHGVIKNSFTCTSTFTYRHLIGQ